jgi:hypothetical protein
MWRFLPISDGFGSLKTENLILSDSSGRNPIDRIPGITILPATLECHFCTQLGTGQSGMNWAADRIANRVSVHAVRRGERAQTICE